MREKEAKDFSKSEAELVDVVDTLQRAISIIQKEMAKNPAFLQKRIDYVLPHAHAVDGSAASSAGFSSTCSANGPSAPESPASCQALLCLQRASKRDDQ